MFEVFKAIKEKETEAKKIIEEALAQAEKIKREAERIALQEYEKAYKSAMSSFNQRVAELKEQMAESVNREVKNILSKAEEKSKEIEIRAKSRFEDAVEMILNDILNGEDIHRVFKFNN